MNESCKEFAMIIRRDYPVAIALIILTIIAKGFREFLPPILESGIIPIIQIIITAIIMINIHIFTRDLRQHFKIEVRELKRSEQAVFAGQIIVMMLGNAYISAISTNIFLITLFPIAYGNENNVGNELVILQDILSFTLYPVIGWMNYHIFRQKYLEINLRETRFDRSICMMRKHWVVSSLTIMIGIILTLIFTDFEFTFI